MRSLRTKIVILALSVIVFSNAVIAIIAVNSSQRSLEAEIQKSLVQSVAASAESIKASNEKEFKMLETLASLSDIRNPDISLLDKTHIIYEAMSLDKDYVDVCILDADGNAWINNGVKMISFAEREYYKEPFKTGKRYMTDPFINKVTNTMAIFYSVPVFDSNNNVINVLFCVIDGFQMSNIAVRHTAGESRPVSIVSLRTGLMVASEDHDIVAALNPFEVADQSGNAEYSAIYSSIKKGGTGISQYTLDGEKYITAWQKVEDIDWITMNTVPQSDFQKEISALNTKLILTSLFMTLAAVLLIIILISRVIKPLNTVKNAINEVATGNADLTKRIPKASNDEIGAVVDGFNQFSEKLQDIVSGIKGSKDTLMDVGNKLTDNAAETSDSIAKVYSNIEDMSDQILAQRESVQHTAAAVNQIATNIRSLETMINTQVKGVNKASETVGQLVSSITAVNGSVEQVVRSFNNLQSNADSGVKKQRIVSNRIQEIEEKSASLQDANMVIATIASQTNLLAMNAAIEAAHAGEKGKGFSVVASEIKKLSESSAAESSKINQQIKDILDSVNNVVEASQESMSEFKKVMDLITTTNDVVRIIQRAMDDQNHRSLEINESLALMNESTTQVNNASHEMALGNQSILEEINSLKESSDAMKYSMEKITEGADQIYKSGNELGNIAPVMKSTISDISVQIDQFKV